MLHNISDTELILKWAGVEYSLKPKGTIEFNDNILEDRFIGKFVGKIERVTTEPAQFVAEKPIDKPISKKKR